jgi:hypothetical protein
LSEEEESENDDERIHPRKKSKGFTLNAPDGFGIPPGLSKPIVPKQASGFLDQEASGGSHKSVTQAFSLP